VALTFYGGPDKEYSEHILNLLKTYKIRATFFPTIGQIDQHPELVEREYSDGHILGNQANWGGTTEEQSRQELDDMEQSLKSLSEHRTVLVYAPYNLDAPTPLKTDEAQSLYAA